MNWLHPCGLDGASQRNLCQLFGNPLVSSKHDLAPILMFCQQKHPFEHRDEHHAKWREFNGVLGSTVRILRILTT